MAVMGLSRRLKRNWFKHLFEWIDEAESSDADEGRSASLLSKLVFETETFETFETFKKSDYLRRAGEKLDDVLEEELGEFHVRRQVRVLQNFDVFEKSDSLNVGAIRDHHTTEREQDEKEKVSVSTKSKTRPPPEIQVSRLKFDTEQSLQAFYEEARDSRILEIGYKQRFAGEAIQEECKVIYRSVYQTLTLNLEFLACDREATATSYLKKPWLSREEFEEVFELIRKISESDLVVPLLPHLLTSSVVGTSDRKRVFGLRPSHIELFANHPLTDRPFYIWRLVDLHLSFLSVGGARKAAQLIMLLFLDGYGSDSSSKFIEEKLTAFLEVKVLEDALLIIQALTPQLLRHAFWNDSVRTIDELSGPRGLATTCKRLLKLLPDLWIAASSAERKLQDPSSSKSS